MALRGLGVAAVGGGLVSAIGWLAPVVLLGAVAMAIAAVCWVLNDHERPRRLALLIRAWRTQHLPAEVNDFVKAAAVRRTPDAPCCRSGAREGPATGLPLPRE